MRKLLLILLGVVTLGLAACGGNEDTIVADPPVIVDPNEPVAPELATLELITSSPQIPSDGQLPVTITAFVRDIDNNFVEGQTVTFSADSGGLAVPNPSVTDEGGVATATLAASGNPENRTITVTAFAGDLSDSVQVQVIGTILTLTGPDSLVQGDDAEYSVFLADAAGNGIAGRAITVASANGNSLSATSLTTDITGSVTVTLTADVGGTDTLSVAGLNLTATQEIEVSDDSFAFVSPAEDTEIVLNATQTVTVELLVDGVPQVNTNVLFSTTRGAFPDGDPMTVDPSTVNRMTDANGRASVDVSSVNAGPAIVAATVDNGPTTQLPIEFIATNPSKIDLQAAPFTVAPNGQSTITAVVRDAANNLVKNQRVVFTVDDITGGSLTIGSAVTDSQGRAQTFYTAADTVSGSQGVIVTGAVEAVPGLQNSIELTVARRELFVALGTGNELFSPNTAEYEVEFSVLVTDSEGNGVPNAQVQLNTKSVTYQKGSWVNQVFDPVSMTFQDTATWVPFVSATCDDEDDNGNGILDDTEDDENNNGTIEAGNVVLVTPGQPITDDAGRALVRIVYGQFYGFWTKIRLEAKLNVAGNEFSEGVEFVLPILADDVELDIQPPGVVTPPDPAAGYDSQFVASPWGYADNCIEDF